MQFAEMQCSLILFTNLLLCGILNNIILRQDMLYKHQHIMERTRKFRHELKAKDLFSTLSKAKCNLHNA